MKTTALASCEFAWRRGRHADIMKTNAYLRTADARDCIHGEGSHFPARELVDEGHVLHRVQKGKERGTLFEERNLICRWRAHLWSRWSHKGCRCREHRGKVPVRTPFPVYGFGESSAPRHLPEPPARVLMCYKHRPELLVSGCSREKRDCWHNECMSRRGLRRSNLENHVLLENLLSGEDRCPSVGISLVRNVCSLASTFLDTNRESQLPILGNNCGCGGHSVLSIDRFLRHAQLERTVWFASRRRLLRLGCHPPDMASRQGLGEPEACAPHDVKNLADRTGVGQGRSDASHQIAG